MARIRTIKPEFWTDEKTVTLSPFARLLFIGLWNFVDDYGRTACSPARLKMQIFPADSIDLHQLLVEISGIDLITIYAVDGKQYLQVNGFSKHQKVDTRQPSKFPPPPISADLHQIPPLEGKGREGNGNAPDGSASAPDVPTPEVDYFRRIKEICGSTAGGLGKRLLDAKNGNIPLARAAIEQASTKENPREYLGAIIRNRDGPNDAEARGRAW